MTLFEILTLPGTEIKIYSRYDDYGEWRYLEARAAGEKKTYLFQDGEWLLVCHGEPKVTKELLAGLRAAALYYKNTVI
jgi:hypothetical protein